MSSRATRRAAVRNGRPPMPNSTAWLNDELGRIATEFFDLNRAATFDESEPLQLAAGRVRMYETLLYHRAARGAMVRFLVDRFEMAEPGLWGRLIVQDDREDVAPALPSRVLFQFTLPLDGGGEIVNQARADGVLAPVCAFLWEGRHVGDVATMAEVRAMQDAHRGDA